MVVFDSDNRNTLDIERLGKLARGHGYAWWFDGERYGRRSTKAMRESKRRYRARLKAKEAAKRSEPGLTAGGKVGVTHKSAQQS